MKIDVITLGETMAVFSPNQEGYLRYAKNFSLSYAGSETNVAIGLARMGHKSGWISRVGDDELGKGLTRFLLGEGIDLSCVKVNSQAPTGLMFKEYLRKNKIRVTYYRKGSAASTMIPADIEEEYLKQARYLFVSGITPALSETCYQTVIHTIQLAKKNSLKVIFDPNLRKSLWEEARARDILLEIAGQSDIFLPGIQELEFMYGESSAKNYAEIFKEIGCEIMVVKLGEQGACLVSQEEEKTISGFHVAEIVDAVGAGDAFAAGFISGLLEGMSAYDSVVRANAMGALVTQVKGDIEGMVERPQLEEFMSNNLNDVDR